MNLRRALWISLGLMLVGMAAIVFWTAPRIEAGGLAPFDTRSGGYGHAEAVAFLSRLTPEGRVSYLGVQRIADTIFPIGLYGLLSLGTFVALRRWSVPLAAGARLLAHGYFVFDMLENAAVAGVLTAGPQAVMPQAVAWASFCTIWKYRFVDAALVVFALGWGARGVARLTER